MISSIYMVLLCLCGFLVEWISLIVLMRTGAFSSFYGGSCLLDH